MLRLIVAFCAWVALLLGFIVVSQAQPPRLSVMGVGGKSAAAAGYTGPGDVVASAKWWVGLRAYSSAKRGNPSINVCNVADVVCADLSTDATTGALTITTVGGSSCSVVTCTIKTFYDQTQGTECSGAACDFTQATIANRPILTVSCVSGLPCAACTIGAATRMDTAVGTSYTQPYTFSTASVRTGGFTTLSAIAGDGFYTIGYASSANLAFSFESGSSTATAADSTFHALQFIFNGASGDINVNGSVNTVNPGSGVSGAATHRFCNNNSQPMTGNTVEVGMWNLAFSSGDSSSMSANQRAYWGF